MAMLVVLLQAAEGDVLLGSLVVNSLAGLGVTSFALLRDERTICIVLEGWAFNPVGSASDVLSTMSAATRSAQLLQPAMQMAIETVPRTGKAGPVIAEGGEP